MELFSRALAYTLRGFVHEIDGNEFQFSIHLLPKRRTIAI